MVRHAWISESAEVRRADIKTADWNSLSVTWVLTFEQLGVSVLAPITTVSSLGAGISTHVLGVIAHSKNPCAGYV